MWADSILRSESPRIGKRNLSIIVAMGPAIFAGHTEKVVALYRSLCTQLQLRMVVVCNSGGFHCNRVKELMLGKTCTHNHNVDCGETQLGKKDQN